MPWVNPRVIASTARTTRTTVRTQTYADMRAPMSSFSTSTNAWLVMMRADLERMTTPVTLDRSHCSRELVPRGHEVEHQFCACRSTGQGATERRAGDPVSFTVRPIRLREEFVRYSPFLRLPQELQYAREANRATPGRRAPRHCDLVECSVAVALSTDLGASYAGDSLRVSYNRAFTATQFGLYLSPQTTRPVWRFRIERVIGVYCLGQGRGPSRDSSVSVRTRAASTPGSGSRRTRRVTRKPLCTQHRSHAACQRSSGSPLARRCRKPETP